MNYSIGIVTYIERFEQWFKPLMNTIRVQQPDREILVCVNGEHNKPFNEQYRKDILTFLSAIPNVYPFVFTTHRSLSKLWNNLLINSSNDIVLRMDDDITIPDPSFWMQIDQAITNTQGRSFKINGSWSHTVLNRKEVNELGWCDERFLGGGEEDGDFEWRYEEHFGRAFANIYGFNIVNHWDRVDFDKCLVNMKKCNGKRSEFNLSFAHSKFVPDENGKAFGILFGGQKLKCALPTTQQYPYEQFFWENAEKL